MSDSNPEWLKREDARERERTAATILAALTTDRMVPDEGQALDEMDRNAVHYAVRLADALRAELEKPR